ncbi:MAG: D-alanyl-D-alanine carboxypeptidase family protein [Alphaproteobacteria bacterium]
MILFEKNADEKMPTSSMSKVMTMYMVFDALKNGSLNLDDTLLVSEKAWRKGGSKMFVEVNKRVKVEDLIRGVIIQSGNDATIVLAEGLAGTELAFAKAATEKAHELGMKNSNFVNASGWPDPQHYSTARDLAILGKAIISNFPEHYDYYSETEFTYSEITQKNRNPLLYRDMGADGIKTGHTEAGGYGLIGSGTHDGRRVVIVVNGLDSEQSRAQEGAKLLEWGLRGFENKTLLKSGQNVGMAEVAFGKKESVPLQVQGDVIMTLQRIGGEDVKMEAVYTGPLKAPVRKGDVIGSLKVHVPTSKQVMEYPLLAGEDIAPLGFFSGTIAKAKQYLAGGA